MSAPEQALRGTGGFVITRRDLEAKYASLDDQALTTLGKTQLTELARSCLNEELVRRNLSPVISVEAMGSLPAPQPLPISTPTPTFFKRALTAVRLTGACLLILVGMMGLFLGFSEPSAFKASNRIVTAFLFIAMGGSIWSAEDAQPLAGLSYKWGTYVALMSGAVSIAVPLNFLLLDLLSSSLALGLVTVILALIVAVPFATASIGLLRRRRFGVVAFLVTGTLLQCLTAASTLGGGSKARLGILITLLVFVIPNYIYFAKRWSLMAREKEEKRGTTETIPDATGVNEVAKEA
jgi:hypothetical protein